jgi:uncharacterized protein with ParB-like and HNH nuclease domain
MKYRDIPQYTSQGNYSPTMRLREFIKWIDENIEELGLQLNPDFQRGHVWTEEQQIKYIEHLLKGGRTANVIYFNHPNWMGSWKGDFVCVDGLQRTTAIQRFMNNEIPVFGIYLDEFEDKDYMLRSIEIIVNVNNLKTRKEVLQWYIEFNSAGTIHTEEEINRVKLLLEKEG